MKLVKYEAARYALQQATKIDDAKEIRDQAQALAAYARQRRDTELESYVSRIKIRADIRIGELSRELENGAGRPAQILPSGGKNYKNQALAAAGLSTSTANRCEQLAKVYEEQPELVEAEFEKAEEIDKPLRPADILKHQKKEESKKEKEEKKHKALSSLEKTKTNKVLFGDSFELAENLPDASCQLIFCDPPYDRASIGLYQKTLDLASRVLVDGGSLLAYSGQINFPNILEMTSANMRYFWTCACIHKGNVSLMNEYGIRVGWKPILWWVKGSFRNDRESILWDTVSGGKEKTHHEWQQSEIEAGHYISALTQPGDLVIDPFCGGGTTAMAAQRLQRKFWTADIDPVAATDAEKRLENK